ncbi:hypothetical protein [Yersinia phage MHG19]|nr:hypothetical protein [Yersinia phage MHG19]
MTSEKSLQVFNKFKSEITTEHKLTFTLKPLFEHSVDSYAYLDTEISNELFVLNERLPLYCNIKGDEYLFMVRHITAQSQTHILDAIMMIAEHYEGKYELLRGECHFDD